MTQPRLDAIFPTCIYSHQLDSNLYQTDIDIAISKYMFNRQDGIQGEYLGLADMHQNPVLQDFYRAIADNARIYTDTLGINNKLFDFYIVKSCLSKHSYNDDTMGRHVHNCSDISFVYYYQVPENSAALMFHDDNQSNQLFGGMFARERDRQMLTQTNPFNATEWYMKPVKGLLVMFPGKLPHSTRKLTEEQFVGERIAIVGDINLVLKPDENNWETGKVSLSKWVRY